MEDIRISAYLTQYGNASLASRKVAQRFSMETISSRHPPIGTHKPWLYILIGLDEIDMLRDLSYGDDESLEKWLNEKGKSDLFPLIRKISVNSEFIPRKRPRYVTSS